MEEEMIHFTDEDEIEAAFQYYRKTGFPYPNLQRHEIIHIFRELQRTKSKIIHPKNHLPGLDFATRLLTTPNTDQILANHFHPHIYESHAENMRSPIQSYGIDKSLRKAITLTFIVSDTCKWYGKPDRRSVLRQLHIVNGTQPCSNFRPSAAKAIYDYLGGNDVLDMSTGYGGRLLGFLASSCTGTYTGIDPSRRTYKGNLAIVDEFKAHKRVRLILSAFEDVPISKLPKVDVAFTSTPYFGKEIYDESPEGKARQSRERYPTYPKWKEGFLKPLIRNTCSCLVTGGTIALNIADVTIKGHKYPLIRDTIQIAKETGWCLSDRLEIFFSGFGKELDRVKTEPVLIFRHK
jgi:hypothetical protein